jgi:hypothetical protein
MEGDGAYNQHANMQAAGAALATPFLEKAVQKIARRSPECAQAMEKRYVVSLTGYRTATRRLVKHPVRTDSLVEIIVVAKCG